MQTPIFSESALGDYQGPCGERGIRPLHFPPALRESEGITNSFSLPPGARPLLFPLPTLFQATSQGGSYLHVLTEGGVGAEQDLALLVGAVVHPGQFVREPHRVPAPRVCHQQAGAHLGPGTAKRENYL